jgi:hypothetical protein
MQGRTKNTMISVIAFIAVPLDGFALYGFALALQVPKRRLNDFQIIETFVVTNQPIHLFFEIQDLDPPAFAQCAHKQFPLLESKAPKRIFT